MMGWCGALRDSLARAARAQAGADPPTGQSGHDPGEIRQMAGSRARLPSRATSRHAQVGTEQPPEAAEHVAISQTQVLGVVRALPDAVAPAERHVVVDPALGAVVNDGPGLVPDDAAGGEQAEAHVVVLGVRGR
jgi:hypothetical protein